MPANENKIRQVCVYCASSRACDELYFEAAENLGRELARNRIGIVYGGGGGGLMGRLADAALREGGCVTGILPHFMNDLEWGHRKLTELLLVEGMHERKRAMLDRADAVIALPGGCGTLEELFEAIAWKRLGLYLGPIVLVNVRGFFDPCIELLERCVDEKFMDQRHRDMWIIVSSSGEVVKALRNAPSWSARNRSFAVAGVARLEPVEEVANVSLRQKARISAPPSAAE
ncbi:MAG TPA: TIGR00730 family Rossman fold protein [Terriglobia bacterium]|nr:TIGR00730 family Rossman fold protein [Terriglobia bacterium]